MTTGERLPFLLTLDPPPLFLLCSPKPPLHSTTDFSTSRRENCEVVLDLSVASTARPSLHPAWSCPVAQSRITQAHPHLSSCTCSATTQLFALSRDATSSAPTNICVYKTTTSSRREANRNIQRYAVTVSTGSGIRADPGEAVGTEHGLRSHGAVAFLPAIVHSIFDRTTTA